jgi:hypothetical protein
MPLVSPPQLLGLARVNVLSPDGVATATYDFADGFDSDRLDGAPSSPTIYVPTAGTYVLFLDNPEAAGAPTNQGGIKARVDAVAVATATNTATIGSLIQTAARIEMRWYYGDYVLPTAYAGVDPRKAIVVRAFQVQAGTATPYIGSLKFDIAVFRDPMTKFVPKLFVG